MSLKAKEILKDKFWIVESEGKNVATISYNDQQYMLSDNKGSRFFNSQGHISKSLNQTINWTQLDIKETHLNEVNGFPTSCDPYNSMYDVKRKLPLFTKSDKSKSLYCAGYYIIRFEKGWVKSFCPKLITVERYDYKGPFKTTIEMRQALSDANK